MNTQSIVVDASQNESLLVSEIFTKISAIVDKYIESDGAINEPITIKIITTDNVVCGYLNIENNLN